MAQSKHFDPEERLDRAVNAFWKNGFDGIGMQELCKAMRLFPGSVYGTYGDKHRLFVRAIERYMATVSAEAAEILGGGHSGLGAIKGYFAHLMDGILDGNRRWGCLVTNTIVEFAQKEPVIRTKIDAHLLRLEAAFVSAILRAQQEGDISSTTPAQELASFFVCVVQGLNVLAKTKPSRQRLEQIVQSALLTLEPRHEHARKAPSIDRSRKS
jgi:TetR/AcrR family transcriptional regulator, transcriptional repressor for nem operon